jgi:tetratricopeptide (TPR) repeat protein
MEIAAVLRRTPTQPRGWHPWEAPQPLAQQITDACCWNAIFWLRNGNFEWAIEALSKVLKIDPGNKQPRFWRGLAYEEDGKFGHAAEDYQMASHNATMKLCLGRSLVRASLNHSACDDLQEDRSNEPVFEKHRLGRAISSLGDALSDDEKNAGAFFWRGLANYLRSREEPGDSEITQREYASSACDDFSKTITLNPRHASA